MTPIVRAWGCLAQNERKACKIMADVYGEVVNYVSRSTILGALLSPSSPPFTVTKREQAWREIYNCPVVVISEGEMRGSWYFADQLWMAELKTALLLGEVTLTDPKCLQLAFHNAHDA